MNNTMSIFDIMYPKYKIAKPIRLIEMFAGYGSQALALKYLGVPFEHWKICEWAVKSIQAYKDIHFTDKFYWKNVDDCTITKEILVDTLFNVGISSNYNEPMSKEQIQRLSYEQLVRIYENILITNNLVNIQGVKGKDLEIVDTDKYEYIMTYSFPCQDLSLAGKGKGMSDTSTRSGMLWEVERILTECKELGTMPQVLLMENVPQVHSQDNMPDFHKWQVRLEELGYKSYWQDLIATDYGIPQTRNRCFMISILGDYSYTFPKPMPLKLKLKDMLEDNVDEKYYLNDKQIESLENGSYNASKPSVKLEITDRGICQTLDTMSGGNRQPLVRVQEKYYLSNKMIDYITSKDDKYKVNENKLVINRDIACSKTTREGNTRADTTDYICDDLPENYNIKNGCKQLYDLNYYNHEQSNRVYSTEYSSPTLRTKSDDAGTIKIINATKQGYLEATDGDGVDISSRMEHPRGNVQKDKIQTLTTSGGNDRGVCVNGKPKVLGGIGKKDSNNNTQWKQQNRIYDNNVGIAVTTCFNPNYVDNNLRIRKLTPRECFRLMGVKDEDFDKVSKNQSDASLYHLAGDSIVVNVLMAIFKELLKSKGE